MSGISFAPESEVSEILKGLSESDRTNYINAAIKAYASQQSAKTASAAVAPGGSPAEQVVVQLSRIFEGPCASISAADSDSPAQVVLVETASQLRVKCETADALDILKSLRQPITEKEVWEILSSLG